jgi:hypothetical protein
MIITSSCDIPVWLGKHLNGEQPTESALPGFLKMASSFDEDDFDSVFSDPEINKTITDGIEKYDSEYKEKQQQMTTPFWEAGKIPRARGVNDSIKKRINKKIHTAIKGLKDSIPLQDLLKACEEEGLIPLDEDNTRLSGIMLVGGGECGSEQSKSQRATINMAIKLPDGSYAPTTSSLQISWCKLGNKYEVTSYYA